MSDLHADLRETRTAREKAILKQHNASISKSRRTEQGKTIAMLLLAGGLGWAVWNNQRLAAKAEGKEVVYATIRADGELISSVHYSETVSPVGLQQSVGLALWEYVRARECFNTPSYTRQDYIMKAMSESRISAQIKRDYNSSNPESPLALYGTKSISVQCELVDPPTPVQDDLMFFRFRRALDNGRVSAAELQAAPVYTVTIRYRTGIFSNDPRRNWLDRSTFNPAGVQVIDYPRASPENVRGRIGKTASGS